MNFFLRLCSSRSSTLRLSRLGVWVIAGLAPAHAAEEPAAIPLDRLVAEITAHNPELKFYEAEIAAAQGARRTAGAWPDPELSLEAGRKRARDAAGVLVGEGTAWSVALRQTFEWPGRLGLRKSIANRQVELAELGFARFQAALAGRARTLAFGLHVANSRRAAVREVARRIGRTCLDFEELLDIAPAVRAAASVSAPAAALALLALRHSRAGQ